MVVALSAGLAPKEAPVPAATRKAREGEGGPEGLQAPDTKVKSPAEPARGKPVARRQVKTVRAGVLAMDQARGMERLPSVVSPVDHHIRRCDPVRGTGARLVAAYAGRVARMGRAVLVVEATVVAQDGRRAGPVGAPCPI